MTSSQKVVKGLAIALAVFIIIAMINGVLFLTGLFGIFTYGKADIKMSSYRVSDVDNLEINIGASNLDIVEGSEFKIELPDYMKYEVNNNKLVITDKKHLFRNFKDAGITIYIPKSKIFDNVVINGGAGKINIDELKSGIIKFELGAGKVTINSLDASTSFKLDGGAGDFKLLKGNLNNADIDMGIGNFNLKTIFTGIVDIDMGVGNLDIDLIDDTSNYKFDIDKGIGNVTIDGESASGLFGNGDTLIKIDGGVGNIKIY